MERSLPRLLSIFLFLTTSPDLLAQCSFPLKITTSKDFCLGSSLLLNSDHALRKIVWYRDGQPVDSAFAAQALDTRGVIVANTTTANPTICLDTAGNLYTYDYSTVAVKKFAPGSTTGAIVAGGHGKGPAADQTNVVSSIYVDDQNNLYTLDNAYSRIEKWTPGGTVTILLDLGNPFLYGGGPHSLLPDCSGTIYYTDDYRRKVMAWTPGADTPVTIVTLQPLQGVNAGSYFIGVQKDAAGNLFVLDATSNVVWSYAPGSSKGTLVAGNNISNYGGSTQNVVSDFWVDADDTVYLLYPYLNRLVRWAPGVTTGSTVLDLNTALGSFPNTMSRDIHGNFYLSLGSNNNIVEYKLTTDIDTSLTPTLPGVYYAMVTDVLGHTQTSDTIYINTPQNGPPAIDITATATSTPVCTPITFTATTTNAGPDATLQWEVSGVKAGNGNPTYSNNLFANGDQIDCILTTAVGCTGVRVNDTSNMITLQIDPQGSAAVTITATDTAICQGNPVVFQAVVTNGSSQPVFQWLLNGQPIPGDDTAAYHTDSLANGNIITCVITSDNTCGLAKSNSIPLLVSAPPTIAQNQTFSIRYGQSLTLDPVVTGNILSWLWTPGAGLSDSTIPHPVADPATTTDYKLKIVSAGCGADSGYILVDVYTPLNIPNAFTPNGDGHNDILYVLGGPLGSRIEDFSVFNRWGAMVFHAHDANPGDPSAGWNGYLHGQPAPPDTYVYQVVMRYADGSRQIYKGTVLLIR